MKAHQRSALKTSIRSTSDLWKCLRSSVPFASPKVWKLDLILKFTLPSRPPLFVQMNRNTMMKRGFKSRREMPGKYGPPKQESLPYTAYGWPLPADLFHFAKLDLTQLIVHLMKHEAADGGI